MAVQYNPAIVTDGLVLCLDAANLKSYPANGVTWNNLIFNTPNGILINGPVFSNLYGGEFINDNLNDYINTNFTMGVSNFTISIWGRRTSVNYWSPLWASEVWNNSTGYLGYLDSPTTIFFQRASGSSISATVTNSNLPSLYTFSLNSSGAAKIYQNNSLIASGSITLATSIEKTIKLNTRHTNDGSSVTDTRFGNIYAFNYYNRVLSDSEVIQNFNALRGRFGI